MSIEFGFYINLPDKCEFDQIKAFVKEFYSCVDWIDENMDSSCGSCSVCADCLGIDGEAADYVASSIFEGTLAIELAKKGFRFNSISMNFEEIGISAGTYNNGFLDYRAISYYDCEIEPGEDYTSTHITGSVNDGFIVEKLDEGDELFDLIDDQYSEIMAASYRESL